MLALNQPKHLLILLTLLQRFSGTTWVFSLNVPSSEFWQDTLVSYSSSFPIFSPLCLHISPPIRALAVWRARRTVWTWRCLGSVTHTTPGLRQPSVEEHFEADLDILFNLFICGKSIFGKLLKTFFFFCFFSWSFFRWKSDRFFAASVGLTSLLLGSPWLGGMGTL